MLTPSGQLGKLRVLSFRKPKMTPVDILGVMETLINPEGYNQSYEIKHEDDQSKAESNPDPKYAHTLPESMEFRFVFDRTGVFPNSPAIPGGVAAEITLFKELTYQLNGEMHRPPYLKLIWGTLIFPCVLEKMDIQYKLFKPDGTPIRAEIIASFKRFEDFSLRSLIANLQSPDLTHVHQVKDGETLSYLCDKIYGSDKYIVEVAKANQLFNLRKLTPGRKILFPPIEK